MLTAESLYNQIDVLKAKVEHNSISPVYLGNLLADIVGLVESVDLAVGQLPEITPALPNVVFFDSVDEVNNINVPEADRTAPYLEEKAPAGSKIVVCYKADHRFYGYDEASGTFYRTFDNYEAFGTIRGKGIAPKPDTIYICRNDSPRGRIFIEAVNPGGWEHLVSVDSAVRSLIAVLEQGKVDKVPGKGLSTNDYISADREKLAELPTRKELTLEIPVPQSKRTATAEDKMYVYCVDDKQSKQSVLNAPDTLIKQHGGELWLQKGIWNSDNAAVYYTVQRIPVATTGCDGVMTKEVFGRLGTGASIYESTPTLTSVKISYPNWANGGARTFTLNCATSARAGLMSAADKNKLDTLLSAPMLRGSIYMPAYRRLSTPEAKEKARTVALVEMTSLGVETVALTPVTIDSTGRFSLALASNQYVRFADSFKDASGNRTLRALSELPNADKVPAGPSMFAGFKALRTIDLGGLDTSAVTDMGSMFYGCSALVGLDLSGFNTSNVTKMNYMFNACASLLTLDVSTFDTSRVTAMCYMFADCSALTVVDVTGFNTASVTDMSYMFYNCAELKELDLSSFDTSNVTEMDYMFFGCRELETLRFGTLDMSSATLEYMFHYCSRLKKVTGTVTGISEDISFYHSPLTRASALVFLNGLTDISAITGITRTITLSKTTYNLLKPADIAIATEKGWSVQVAAA